jgi:4-amino-4-deoxy-L-arabinose transferase-like glycosyltransferase
LQQTANRFVAPTAGADSWTGRAVWVWAAVLGLVAARLIAAAVVDLGPDEAYYRLWSRYPDWSYYDHPPMAAWWIALGTRLFGDNAFGVRALFVLSSVPTSLAVYATGRVLFDNAVALRAVLWVNATLLIGVGGFLATPDAPAVMFWSLTILAFGLVAGTGRGDWWPAVGLSAGLAVSSKLTALFLGPGLLLALVAVRALRRWLTSPWTYAGALVAILVLIPLLAWNLDHGWVTLASQFRRVTVEAFRPLGPPEFLVTQFLVLNPLVAIFAGLAAVAVARRLSPYPVAGIAVLMWTVLPLAAYMTIHAFQEQIQGHWLAPIYPTLALVAAAAAQAAPGERWAGLRSATFPTGAALTLCGLVLAANPGGILPLALDPGQAIRGWAGVAGEVARLREETGARWIATTQYGVDAEIAYHLRDTGVPVVPIAGRVRYAFAPEPDAALAGEPTLIVSTHANLERLAECFADISPLGAIERAHGGKTIQTLHVFLGGRGRADLFDHDC